MEYRVIKYEKLKPNFWLTKTGLSFIVIFSTGYIPLLIFLVSQFPDYENQYLIYKQNYSELRLDSIKKGKPYIQVNPTNPQIANLYGISFWFKITNHSNSVCYIIMIATIDTLSLDDNIRKKVFRRDTTNLEVVKDTSFKELLLYPNESKWFEKHVYLSALENYPNEYIHCQVIYSNTVGGYYDLYFIQELKYDYDFSNPLPQEIDTIITKDSILINTKIKVPELFTFTDNKQILPPYSFTVPEIEFIKFVSKIKPKIINK